ncbi:MAG: ribosome small subunit-dependent GTPase A [Paludibacteraceae bacterium]|nr:ribosome small subunit-dependent GTPase A [Paludibacteraceae bacterium]
MRGLVIKTTGNSYTVQPSDGSQPVTAYVKGNFRIRGIRSTNPVAVGDYVQVEQQADGTNWITDIEDRRNYIIRRSTNLSKQTHILAANIDQAILIVTVAHPVTSTKFIDRFLATAEAYRVPAVLIFNKIDLFSAEERQTLDAWRSLYTSLDYPTYVISATRLNPQELMPLFENKVSLLSGNSGVGKSTLLNTLLGQEITRTAELSSIHDSGMHTTTFSEMYPLASPDGHGYIIDTPGIKGFGSVEMAKEEVSHYFREIFRIGRSCRYGNCLHLGETDCAVIPAVERGEIAFSRYDSYLSLLGDCEENKYR